MLVIRRRKVRCELAFRCNNCHVAYRKKKNFIKGDTARDSCNGTIKRNNTNIKVLTRCVEITIVARGNNTGQRYVCVCRRIFEVLRTIRDLLTIHNCFSYLLRTFFLRLFHTKEQEKKR